MISKASELLELFIKEETKKLTSIDMPHMPTLGSAYEEITKQGIDKEYAIPKSLDLKMVSGFISIGDEVLPQQIDCMLVSGAGEKYGLTEQYIYNIENVLCIFEVKKTLSKEELLDAMLHLGSIRKKFAKYLASRIENGAELNINVAKKYYSKITRQTAPENCQGIFDLLGDKRGLFFKLIEETLAPVTIIHGYYGYKTEKGLRKAMADILDDKNISISSIPSLIVSNQFCLIKSNGIPFMPIGKKDDWVFLCSVRHNSVRLILESVWSKVSSYFSIKMPWDDGLYMENLVPLLTGKFKKINEEYSFVCNSFEPKEKDLNRKDDNLWQPVFLNKVEMSAVNIMVMCGGYLSLDQEMKQYLDEEYSLALEELREGLLHTGYFMEDGCCIRPISSVSHVITLDDGTGYISSEKERFDLWCQENGVDNLYMNLYILESD